MTLEDVRARVEEIKQGAGLDADNKSNEQLHIKEDGLYLLLLEAIADGTAENPKEMAALAIETQEYSFSRWYA